MWYAALLACWNLFWCVALYVEKKPSPEWFHAERCIEITALTLNVEVSFFCLPPLLFRYFSLCFVFCFCARLVGSFPSVDLRPLPFFFLLHVELETFFCFDRRTSSLLMFSFFFWFYYDYYFGVSKFFCRLFCFVYRPFFGGYWIGFLEGLSLLWSKMNISEDADEEIWIFLFVPHPHRF